MVRATAPGRSPGQTPTQVLADEVGERLGCFEVDGVPDVRNDREPG